MDSFFEYLRSLEAVSSFLVAITGAFLGVIYGRRTKNAEVAGHEIDTVIKAQGGVQTVLGTLDDVLKRLDDAEERNSALSKRVAELESENATHESSIFLLQNKLDSMVSKYEKLNERYLKLLESIGGQDTEA